MRVRGSWRLKQDCNILTSPAPPDIAMCRSRSPDAQPEAWGLSFLLAFSTTSCHQRVSKTTGGPVGPFGRVQLSLPHLVSNSSYLQLTDSLSSPSYIIVQSPTQSLEWHVWSSSSGNNCHAVERSLSSGASVYECIMGFYLVPFRQPNPPTWFLSITGHWNVSLPSGASLWNDMFGWAEGQYITLAPPTSLWSVWKGTTSHKNNKILNLFS